MAEGHGPERKLSRHTIHRCLSLVSAVFTEAVERELIPTNPCIGVKARKQVDERDTQEKSAFLTMDEQKAIAGCIEIPHADRLMIRFALATGLRQGEQLNLELPELVLSGENPHVLVRYGTAPRDGVKYPPKSGRVRKVPLFTDGLAAARGWMANLPTYCQHNPENLVFPTPAGKRRPQGKPLGKSSVFREHLALVGITRRVRWHDLRHSAISSLVNGEHGRVWTIKEAQQIAGHSSSQITEQYCHSTDALLEHAARETNAAAPAPPSMIESSLLGDALRALATTAKRVVWTVIDKAREEIRDVA
jgi:integrase